MPQPFYSKSSQSGQGLVEYAILLLLTITLVIGGVELASTSMASSRSSEAAKAGVNEYVAVNEERITLQKNIARYLERLERETSTNTDLVDYLDATTNAFNGVGYLWRAYQENTGGFLVFDFASTVPTTFNDNYFVVYNGTDNTSPIIIGNGYEDLFNIIQRLDGVLDDGSPDGLINEDDRDDSITSEELYHALKYRNSLFIDADFDGSTNELQFNIVQEIKNLDPVTAAETEAKFQALIVFEHMILSTLPMDPRASLSESVVLLADHDIATMERPNCNVDDPGNIFYDHGFYGVDIDVDGDGFADAVPHMSIDSIDYPAVYLFNPLPIDMTNCQGKDSARDDKTRISLLVGGYGNAGDLDDINTFSPGMPQLNQSYYSQYQYVCLDGNQYVSCASDAVGVVEYLKPPGKMCLTELTSDTIDSCPGINAVDPEYVTKNVTGYYFWGRGSDSDPDNGERFQWLYASSNPPEFRPSFQLLCNGESPLTESVVGPECQALMPIDGTNAIRAVNKVEVNVRYRSVFESFLAFGMHELKDDLGLGLKYYFFDPANLRALANDQVSGSIVGSELGPKQGDLPTVKPFKDFRGCYEVNVETNQVSACN